VVVACVIHLYTYTCPCIMRTSHFVDSHRPYPAMTSQAQVTTDHIKPGLPERGWSPTRSSRCATDQAVYCLPCSPSLQEPRPTPHTKRPPVYSMLRSSSTPLCITFLTSRSLRYISSSFFIIAPLLCTTFSTLRTLGHTSSPFSIIEPRLITCQPGSSPSNLALFVTSKPRLITIEPRLSPSSNTSRSCYLPLEAQWLFIGRTGLLHHRLS
jgi:hypothetical protein